MWQTASVIKDGAWTAVLGSGCGFCLGFRSWKKQPDSLICWVLTAARIKVQRILIQESPEWYRFLGDGSAHRRWLVGSLGKAGWWLPLEISGCWSQGSDRERVSSSSDGLCISILDVDKCKEWRNEDNIFGEKKSNGWKKLQMLPLVNTCSTTTETMFEISL